MQFAMSNGGSGGVELAAIIIIKLINNGVYFCGIF